MAHRKRGFTLVEVIVVLAIIAIISVIAIPSLNLLKKNSEYKADIQNCETVRRAINAIIVDEIIKYDTNNKGKVIIDCKDKTQNGRPTISIFNLVEPTSENAQEKIQEYVREVKAPQQKNGGGYTVIIGTDGCIESVSANEHKEGIGTVGDIINNTFIGTIPN